MSAAQDLEKLYKQIQLRNKFQNEKTVVELAASHNARLAYYRKCCDVLNSALHRMRRKFARDRFWFGPLFRLHQARVKGTDDYVDKLFKLALAAGPNPPLLPQICETSLLEGCHDRMTDLVGGRLCVAFSDDLLAAVDVAKEHLTMYGLKPSAAFPDQDYTKNPRSGYRGYHFHVLAPLPDGAFLTAEVQVRSLLNHAWSEACHDLIYKPLKEQRLRELPATIFSDAEALSDSLYACDRQFATLKERVASLHIGRSGGAS